jgi:AraC family transcriptional regulator, activator of mtrCDE
MISLDKLLDGLEVEVEPFLVCDPRREPAGDGARAASATIHCTLNGSGSLELAGGASVRVSTGSVSVVPTRLGARLVPDRGSRRDPDVLVASGRIRATYRGSIDLFDHLREPLIEHVGPDDPLSRSFEDLLDEIRGGRPGCRAMAEALLRRCLILLLRRYCAGGERQPSWLAALEDARLGRAVALMQERPEQSFSLPRLAEVAGMSRSVFAARFAEAWSQSPIEFLKGLRLARAAQLLTRTDLPVKAVAGRVGYASRSAFTRAFVARHGIGPLAFRAASGEPAPGPRAVNGKHAEGPPWQAIAR